MSDFRTILYSPSHERLVALVRERAPKLEATFRGKSMKECYATLHDVLGLPHPAGTDDMTTVCNRLQSHILAMDWRESA